MKRTLLVLAGSFLCIAAPAHAVTLVTTSGVVGPQPYQHVADRALVPTVPGTLAFHTGVCPIKRG
jgi:hypothetical protein